MSNDLNQCQFIGRLGKDVEIRYTPDGKAIANFSIAVGERWKDKNSGQRQEKTTWVPIVIFGKLAEIANQYLKKGSKVFISGKFQVRKWQDQSGQDRYTTEVVVDGFSGIMQMLDSHEVGQQQNTQPQQQQQETQQQQSQHSSSGGNAEEPFDQDIPFVQHEKWLLA